MQLEDEFGDVISKARIGLGWTTARLAVEVGVPERDIQQIESYRLKPGSALIDKLAALLHLEPSKLSAIAEGGWVPKQKDPSTDLILIRKVPVASTVYSSNAYVIGCVRTKMAAVVDPGGAPLAQIDKCLADESLILSNVLITHTHSDHLGGLRELAAAHTGIIVSSATIDRDTTMRDISVPWIAADDASRIDVGEVVVTAVSTPGHTAGSTCYRVDHACFTGDTLFAASIGRPSRTELYQQMLHAIESKLLTLPGSTVLLPGHGPSTTVAQEIEHNPFFQS